MDVATRLRHVRAIAFRTFSGRLANAQTISLRRHYAQSTGFLRSISATPANGAHHVAQRRLQSTGSRPLTDRTTNEIGENVSDADKIALRKALSPAYQLWFTCKQCLERSGHSVSKQSYHFGTCVIQCPKCKKQHLISDHLKIYSDHNITMEDIAKEHGEKLRKGRLGAGGDIEFYDEKDIKDQV